MRAFAVNIIDIGMYDAADTCYDPESGNKVLAAEAKARSVLGRAS
jgi:hypothetical protein